jgi:hypothetical protein
MKLLKIILFCFTIFVIKCCFVTSYNLNTEDRNLINTTDPSPSDGEQPISITRAQKTICPEGSSWVKTKCRKIH